MPTPTSEQPKLGPPLVPNGVLGRYRLFAKLGSDGIGQARFESLIRKRHHLNRFVAGRETAGWAEPVPGAAKQAWDEGEEQGKAHRQCFCFWWA